MSTRTSPPQVTPYSAACRATCAARALATSVFVGMHPTLTQVPPRSLRSTIAVLRPDCASRTARAGPACPAPITIASKSMVTGQRSGKHPGDRTFELLEPERHVAQVAVHVKGRGSAHTGMAASLHVLTNARYVY